MTTEAYIKEALIEDGIVVVTGLGTFRTDHQNATIGDDGEVLVPPSTIVTFSGETVELASHSLLDYISKKEGLEPLDVEQRVIGYVRELKKEVEENGHYDVEGLGRFQRGLYGDYAFSMKNGLNLKSDSFGLPKIEARPLARVDNTSPERATASKKDANLTLWAILIPVIILAVVAGYIFLNEDAYNALFKKELGNTTVQPSNQEESISNNAEENSSEAETTVNDASPKPGVTNTQTKPVEKQKPKADTEVEQKTASPPQNQEVAIVGNVVTDASNRFYLILASFSKLENAKEGMENTRTKGYPNAKVISTNGKYRLSANDFANRAEADEALPSARKDYPGAWIFKF